MAFYTNHTRFAAIVTVRINSVIDDKNVVKIGLPSAPEAEESSANTGYHDFLVRPGQILDLAEGTQADLVAVRSAT
jgi:hypothetical protein